MKTFGSNTVSVFKAAVTSLLIILLLNLSALAGVDCAKRGTLNLPVPRDVLILREGAEYSDPNYVGTNFDATLKMGSREISCGQKEISSHIKCYSEIKLSGTAMEGSRLRIPAGTKINVSRINKSTQEIYLYPRKTEGLLRTRSGTFKVTCSRYKVMSPPGKTPRTHDHIRFTCFDEDVNLLFENTSLINCSETSRRPDGLTDKAVQRKLKAKSSFYRTYKNSSASEEDKGSAIE